MSDPQTPPPAEEPSAFVPPEAAPATPAESVPPAAPAAAVPPTVIVQQAPKNGLATAAMVLGIIGLVFAVLGFIPFVGIFFFDWVAFICGALAIVFGILGTNKAKTLNDLGKSTARTGLILGIVAVALDIISIIVGFIIIAALSAGLAGIGGQIANDAQQCQTVPSGTVLSDGFTCP